LVNTAKRGRVPTSTLATTFSVATSMKCAMLVVSDVHSTVLPSGLTAMPSGSTPTGISDTIRPSAISSTETWLLSSLATNSVFPSVLSAMYSGSGLLGSTRVTVSVAKSSTSI
jgi:hypothetical protein